MKEFFGHEEVYISDIMKRNIKRKEKYLDRKCRKIWACTNRLGQTYLYGSFCKKWNRLVITIGHYVEDVGFVPSY